MAPPAYAGAQSTAGACTAGGPCCGDRGPERDCTWLTAGAPTRRRLSSVKATQEGVVRSPSLLASTCGGAAARGVGGARARGLCRVG